MQRQAGAPRPEQQLSPEGILNSLKRAQAPPQAVHTATDAPNTAEGGRSAPGAAAGEAPMQRPNVRKRFERVMASQISTLNRLISSAANAGDLQVGAAQDKPPDGS